MRITGPLYQMDNQTQQALEAAHIGTWSWNILQDTVAWSGNVESLLGLEPGTFSGLYQDYLELIYPPDRNLVMEVISQTIAGEKQEYHIEHRIRSTNGAVRWLEGKGRVYRDEQGRAVEMVGSVADVTERKQAEMALKRRVNELQTVAEVSTAAATILDPDKLLNVAVQLTQHRFGLYHVHVFLYEPANQSLSIAACGWQRDSPYEGTHEIRILHLNQSQSLVARAARDRQPVVVNNVRENSSWLPNPILPHTRAELAVPMVVGDMLLGVLDAQAEEQDYFTSDTVNVYLTLAAQLAIAIQNARLHNQTRQMLSQLQIAVQELEAKNAELERFTYTVSHDLKSPLITIRGFLGYLQKDAEVGNMERFYVDLVRIKDATNKMQRLLEDLLQLSRVGRVMNPQMAVPFEEIAWEAVALVTGRINENGVKVLVAEDMPLVRVDRPRMVEVMQNLVDNAVKFMAHQPSPRLEIGMRPQGAETVFFVCDNGIGIDVRYHEKIFGLFDKLDAYSEGTGVGLALAKRIIEFHGGKIWVESEGVGHGSCFCFTLPGT